MVRNGEDQGYQRFQCDLIAGGFPCPGISNAGKHAGLSDERSALWWEMLQTVRLVGPRYVLVENVAALTHRGMGEVLGPLASSGYDSEWDCISAASVGALHIRERIFILAHSNKGGCKREDLSIFSRRPCKESLDALRICEEDRWARAIQSRPLGVADGVSSRVDRLKALGNAVVPQVAEFVGRQIIEFDRRRNGTE